MAKVCDIKQKEIVVRTRKNGKHFTFANHTRFVMLVLCTLCLSIIQSNVLTLNFTIICMTGDTSANLSSGNSTETSSPVSSGHYSFSPGEKSWLFSAFAIGALFAVYPMMKMVEYCGTRLVVSGFGFISAASTAVMPLCTAWGVGWMLAARVVQGAGLSVAFTLIAIVTRQWSMQKQSAFYISFLTCFFQFAPIFTMPVSGALCTSSLGWPSVYYLHAAITVVLFLLFAYFYREEPTEHHNVSEKELDRIKRLKNTEAGREPVPYKAMLSSVAVYAVWVTAVGNFMGIQVTMQFSPIYLNKVMGYPVGATGVLSSIPQVVTFIVKIIAGAAADRSTCVHPTIATKMFNAVAVGGMSIFFFGLAFIPTSEPLAGLLCLVACCSIVGFNCGGFFRGSVLMAAQHNHFIMSINSLINCAAALLSPVIVSIFVRSDTHGEWWWVWMTFGVLLFVCNAFYMIFGTAEPAEWTKKKGEVEGSPVHEFPPELSADGSLHIERV